MIRRASSAVALSMVCFALYLSQSGAPMRVHLACAVSLLVGFTLPALFVSEVSDVKRRIGMIVFFSVAGSVLFEVLTAITVAKAEITPLSVGLVLGLSALALAFFLVVHLGLTRSIKLIIPSLK